LGICQVGCGAVCTQRLWTLAPLFPVMPSAVSGLTKQEAPSAAWCHPAAPRHPSLQNAGTARTWRRHHRDHLGPSAPRALRRSGLAPTPALRLPTGKDSSSRPAMAFIPASGTLRDDGDVFVRTPCGRHIGADQQPKSRRIDREASTRTTIYRPGSGVGRSPISRVPLFLISDEAEARSCYLNS